MVLWQQGVRFAAKRMPKFIGPKTHTVLDYAVTGCFVLMAVRFWRSNRRASLGSLLCAGAATANILLTDYPGGSRDLIDYRTHGTIDAGLAGLSATMPRLMGFADEPEAGFFQVQAVVETAITSVTDFDYYE